MLVAANYSDFLCKTETYHIFKVTKINNSYLIKSMSFLGFVDNHEEKCVFSNVFKTM